ncbi:hypothetical protein [uncultured Modestobacter sp.]|uniref:hypothetical protein n=1 Tax=uncultured Modestobacter sp. TaxID=380048 RepID=UPI0026399CED|nr:hypothetical protein [uncultured Modestobacter sp.]
MAQFSGIALWLVLVAVFFFLLYSVVNRAVLNALRTHHQETAGSGTAGPGTPPQD